MDIQIQILRIRKRIAKMVVDYQNHGKYTDMNGKDHTSLEGILAAWNEIEFLGGKL